MTGVALCVFVAGDDACDVVLGRPPRPDRPALADELGAGAGPGVDIEVRTEPASGREVCSPILPAAWESARASNLAVLSISRALHRGPAGDGDQWFIDELRQAAEGLKSAGTHVLVLNASTFDPNDDVSCYRHRPDSVSLRIHRLNLALIELSMTQGISIIDTDRIVAILGAGAHVTRPLRYSDTVLAALRAELGRVLDDYGFLDDRPLMPQVGQRAG